MPLPSQLHATALQQACPYCGADPERGCEWIKLGAGALAWFGVRTRKLLHVARWVAGQQLLRLEELA